MSPRVNVDFDNVAAGIPVLDADEYEFEVGEAKPFARINNKGQQTYGVMYPLSTTYNGNIARIPHNLHLHSAESRGFCKQFIMAALGFNYRDNATERQYNEQYKGQDWIDVEFDGDSGTVNEVGPIYGLVSGTRVKANVTIIANKETGEPQNRFSFMPIAG